MKQGRVTHISSLGRIILLLFLIAPVVHAEGWFSSTQASQIVVVTQAFVEWHTGPAEAYPVTHVSERGEKLVLLKRKTDWFKVSDEHNKAGWVHVDDVLLMQDATGQQVVLSEPRLDDFSSRRWEGGVLFGEFDSTAVNAAYVGYWMTENLSLELSASQVLGDASEIRLLSLNLLHQPFPAWRFSPFFTLGGGAVFIDPKATLADADKRTEESANVGVGARFYITDRYFFRMEVKDYKVFTDRETNEEATEWKLGLSVFF